MRCYKVETGNGKDNKRKEFYCVASNIKEVLDKVSKDGTHPVVYSVVEVGNAI